MQQYATTVLDVTHSLQQPNLGITGGGRPDMIETIAKAGADEWVIETHFDPADASDWS
jgi:2-dehydro-3-deoxyphosphooctonate aldolase (KDO 8-P synthase)